LQKEVNMTTDQIGKMVEDLLRAALAPPSEEDEDRLYGELDRLIDEECKRIVSEASADGPVVIAGRLREGASRQVLNGLIELNRKLKPLAAHMLWRRLVEQARGHGE
jgi:hypothetical protein